MYKFSVGIATFFVLLLFPYNVFTHYQPLPSAEAVPAASPTETLQEQAVCPARVCGSSGWQQWIENSPDGTWKAEELVMLGEILTAVFNTLDQKEVDGYALLNGYRFRRQTGEFVDGQTGRIAVVNHSSMIITLADSAFKRLRGFYIFHELGHVVDHRSERQLTENFHALVGSDQPGQTTAEGYWLNLSARDDLEEATADAFALWVMASYAQGYRPVFAFTPLATNYPGIVAAIVTSFDGLAWP